MTPAASLGARVDDRGLLTSTTARLVQLVVLLTVSSAAMGTTFLSAVFGNSETFGCLLAAGASFDDPTMSDLFTVASAQDDAYRACVDRYEPPPPWWSVLVGPVLVLMVAAAMFPLLPRWKLRRSRVVPLDTLDRDGGVRGLLLDLTNEIGLARVPRLVVDATSTSSNAVVFGSNRRPVVCLHAGLLVQRVSDPARFRATLLHELAHVRNGDVTVTYATVALWRAFVTVILLPYVVSTLAFLPSNLRSVFWQYQLPFIARDIGFVIVMVALVSLARAEVLRSREIYADLAATRWGADPRGWAVPTAAPDAGALRRTVGSLLQLWNTHPRWDFRRRTFTDPAGLFELHGLPMILTGVAATLIGSQLSTAPAWGDTSDPWAEQAVALITAALVTGVAGIALCRAVAAAVLAGRPAPSGIRSGIWLGVGMGIGELIGNQITDFGWVPRHPEVLLLLVLAGVVFARWTVQCAELWLTVRRERTILPAMALVLAGACLVLSAWLAWWRGQGAFTATGWPFDTAAVRATLEQAFASQGGSDHSAMLSVLAVAWGPLIEMMHRPLVWAAIAALWAVPLAAWITRAHPSSAPLRRVLRSASAGAVVGLVAITVVRAATHLSRSPRERQGALEVLAYYEWVVVALGLGAIVAAVFACVLMDRFRLLTALIAAQVGTLAGIAGAFLLTSTDGCIPPLSVFRSSCGWLAGAFWTSFVPLFAAQVLVLITIAAVVVAAIASVVRRVHPPRERHRSPVRPSRAGRVGVGVLIVLGLSVATTMEVVRQPADPSQADVSAGIQLLSVEPSGPPSAMTRALQMTAWKRYGGSDLLRRIGKVYAGLATESRRAAHAEGRIDTSRFRTLCTEMSAAVRAADRYFRIPDASAQSNWRKFISGARKGSEDCVRALDQNSRDLFVTSSKELLEAGDFALSAAARITAVESGARPGQ